VSELLSSFVALMTNNSVSHLAVDNMGTPWGDKMVKIRVEDPNIRFSG
jgi:hypothetical protein